MTASPPAIARDADHPAPHRGKASLLSLWTGLMLGPAAWFLELVIDTSLLGNACEAASTPHAGGVASVLPFVLATDGCALVLTALAAMLAWRNWRRTSGEQAGGHHALLASGEGRTRFMAMAGLLVCGLIALAVVYTLGSHLLLQECGL
jgi:hypothetical protein